jgi:hypothetical protein
MKKKKWIQQAMKGKKKGALSRQLGIPEEKNIPTSLLIHIKNSNVGDKLYIRNYSYDTKEKGYITITKLLKQRAQFAYNIRK